MASSKNPMLAKCLENFPNSNQSNSVKSEFNFNDLFNSSNFIASFNHTNHSNHNHNRPFLNNSQPNYQASVNSVNQSVNQSVNHSVNQSVNHSVNHSVNQSVNHSMNSHLPNTSSFFQNDHLFSTASSISNLNHNDKTKFNNINLQLSSKSQSPKSCDEFQEPIDSASVKGQFGWSICKELPLPYILRKEEKLVPVRVVECQIINKFSKDLPSNVISCISIKSFYITDSECKLLNEINSLHCDNTYGHDKFTLRDVVVKLDDVLNIDNFLETSKRIFFKGLKYCDFLGFVQLTGLSTVIPYIVKETSSSENAQKSNSSIASPLSNLSIKKIESKDKSPLNMQLEDLKYDDLDGILNEEHNSTDKTATFNENSLTDLDDQNLNSNFSCNNNLDNQLESIIYELDNDLNDIESRTQTSTLTNYQQHQESTTLIKKRFVPVQLVDKLLEFNERVEKIDLNEWDCSYLKMICFYAGYTKLADKLKASSKTSTTNSNDQLNDDDDFKLVCLDDLKWNQNLVPIVIKDFELNPSSDLTANQCAQFNQLNHNQQSFNTYSSSTAVQQQCFNFASNDNLNLNKKSQSYLSNHNSYFNPSQQQPSQPPPPPPLNNYTSSTAVSTTPIPQQQSCFNFRTNLDNNLNNLNNLNKKSQTMLTHHNFFNQPVTQSQSSIQMHHKKSNLTKESNLDDIFNNKNNTTLSFNNLNSNLSTNYTTKQLVHHHQVAGGGGGASATIATPKPPVVVPPPTQTDPYLANTNNFANCKTYGLPPILNNSSGLNSIQNTTNSNILNELSKCLTPSNGLSNSTSVNNQLIGANLNYNLNNRNNNLSMINNLGLSNTFNAYQSSNGDQIKISNVTVDNVHLRTSNLKPNSDTQVVLLSEVEKQLFNGIGINQLRMILENAFDLRLYDYTSLHKSAFFAYGLVPHRSDKLIMVDDLKNYLHQIKNQVSNFREYF